MPKHAGLHRTHAPASRSAAVCLLLLLACGAAEAHGTGFNIAVSLFLPLQFLCLGSHVAAHLALPKASVPMGQIENFLCGLSGLAWILGGMGPLFALFF